MTGRPGVRPSPVDLHLHTRASDGDESPAALADRCAAAGVRVAAVTDHDSTAASGAFGRAAAGRFTTVPGCEITTADGGSEAHLLAYWATGPGFDARVARVHDVEIAWWRAWIDRVEAFGVPLTWADVDREIGGDRIAAQADYLALLLRAAGDDPRWRRYAGDHRAVVEDLCRPGGPLHVPRPWVPDLTEAIGWVTDAGGAAVLAHPGLGREPGPAALRTLRDAGLVGVEVWTTWHTAEQSARLAGLCAGAGLVATAGSDYHGTRVKPWAYGPGLLPADAVDPLDAVEALHARRGGGS